MFKLRFPKFNIWSFIIAIFPIMFYLSINGFSVLSYYDEALSLMCAAVVILLFITNKLTTYDSYICILLTIVTLIGILSNLISDLLSEWFPIFIDILWLWKPYAAYIFFKHIALKNNQREKILIELSDYSKFILFTVFVTFAIGQFVNIGVTAHNLKVFGIFKPFYFFWQNGIQTGWLIIAALLVLSVTVESKIFFRYLALSALPLICTNSSMIYCWIAIIVMIRFMLGERYKFKFWHIFIFAPIVILINYNDFQSYLVEESVRKTFFEKGTLLANQYFPLGSGFATFGSEMAKRYYSKLYISWGWENDWTYGRESGFLNDTFFASILGQFGWVAFILYLLILVILFVQANNKALTRNERAITISTVITLAITMTGSGTAKSMMGICIFALLGILCGKSQDQFSTIKLRR